MGPGLVETKTHHFPLPPDRLRSGSHPTSPPRAGAKLRPRKMLRSMEKWKRLDKWRAAIGIGCEPAVDSCLNEPNFAAGKLSAVSLRFGR
ncbi:hypothetical protein FIU94_13805 [Sulfitobacter sp. THAF37]|nr:hypothetical protein FIU94_13805 [Sulfitobacter sp. THAF37]